MAFITKEEVKAKSAKLKEINKKYGVKASFSGSNSSTLKLTISSGKIDFIENFIETMYKNNNFFEQKKKIEEDTRKNKYIQVNQYYIDKHFTAESMSYLNEVYELMNEGHRDESDIITDYFHCSWYNSIHIGRWDKPYELIK